MYNLFLYVLRIIFGYIKSSVLSWVLIPTVGAIVFISTAFSSFINTGLKNVPFLYSILNTVNGTFDEKDLMKFFGIFSLVIYLIIELLKFIGLKIQPSLNRGLISLSSIFIVVILLIYYPTNDLNILGYKSGFVFVFLIFWIVTIIAYYIWHRLNKIKF